MGCHKQKKKRYLNCATQEAYVFSNRSVPARNLRKTDLGSVILGCKNSTINECLSNKLFGLPAGHFSYIKNIRKGLVLFLFNYSNRTLHGIFEATTPGQMNIDKYAWVADGDDTGYTKYPAQVRICVTQECQPLSEKQFGLVIANNYYDYESKHFYFELDHDQTNQLISLFRLNPVNEEMYPQIPTRLNYVNQSVSSMSRDRSRSPGFAKRFRRDRASYRDALCKRDKPGCRNCKESGHLSSECPNDPMCKMCGKIGHLARDCHNPNVSTYDARLFSNCYKPGHLAAECTNQKACNNCRKTGHIARECSNDPVCNVCSISGHVARQCPKSGMSGLAKSRPSSFLGSFGSLGDDPFWDMICRNCGRPGHISRDCLPMSMPMVICNNCGGRGHMEIECPSSPRFISFDHAFPDPRFHRY